LSQLLVEAINTCEPPEARKGKAMNKNELVAKLVNRKLASGANRDLCFAAASRNLCFAGTANRNLCFAAVDQRATQAATAK
jgi:hypothetical protein